MPTVVEILQKFIPARDDDEFVSLCKANQDLVSDILYRIDFMYGRFRFTPDDSYRECYGISTESAYVQRNFERTVAREMFEEHGVSLRYPDLLMKTVWEPYGTNSLMQWYAPLELFEIVRDLEKIRYWWVNKWNNVEKTDGIYLCQSF